MPLVLISPKALTRSLGSAVSTAAVTASDGIMINGIKVGDITGTSAADKAFAINALRSETGVEATARTEAKFQLAE